MVRLQHKIQDGLEVLEYFTTRQWNFESTKFNDLRAELSPTDQEIFFTDFEKIDEDEYLLNSVLGARQYCLKEPLSSIPRCRRNLKM
jgi:Male sterility protein.